MIENIPEIAAVTGIVGLAIAVLLYTQIEKIKIENATVADITQQIRDGAMAFLFAEYRYLAVFIAIVAGLLFALFGPLALLWPSLAWRNHSKRSSPDTSAPSPRRYVRNRCNAEAR